MSNSKRLFRNPHTHYFEQDFVASFENGSKDRSTICKFRSFLLKHSQKKKNCPRQYCDRCNSRGIECTFIRYMYIYSRAVSMYTVFFEIAIERRLPTFRATRTTPRFHSCRHHCSPSLCPIPRFHGTKKRIFRWFLRLRLIPKT